MLQLRMVCDERDCNSDRFTIMLKRKGLIVRCSIGHEQDLPAAIERLIDPEEAAPDAK